MNCLEGLCKELLPEIDISKEQGIGEENEKCTQDFFLDFLPPPFIQATAGKNAEIPAPGLGNKLRMEVRVTSIGEDALFFSSPVFSFESSPPTTTSRFVKKYRPIWIIVHFMASFFASMLS